MTRAALALLALTVFPLSLLTQPAVAQDATSDQSAADEPGDAPDETQVQARAHFAAGSEAFSAGDFETAKTEFERAYELVRLPTLLFNIASCLDRLSRVEPAITRYEAYLAAVPDAENGAYVRSRLVLLREHLEAETSAPDPTAELVRPPEYVEDRSVAGPVTFLVLAGGAAIGAVVAGVLAASSKSDLDAMCVGLACPPEAMSTHDQLQRRALATDLTAGVAVAFGAVGLVWLLVGGGDDDADEVSARCGPLGCSVRGTF